ncbi:hypothetical protein [Amycolatopsis benzoatilytica]|uniref:hypothetical protein n=1 Tax=Amycolatopsis benzoatilytica TaxID=346045 RepID=UPI000363D33D|nr:hypothetical protein [Amycolatopsis benzoatilytica]
MTAAREHVVMGGPPVITPLIETPSGRREYEQAHEIGLEPCHQCEEEGHWVRWRVYPHPGPFPADGVLTEDVEGCQHCTFGRDGREGLIARAERESVDDRDITVEHLERDGSWKPWNRWF